MSEKNLLNDQELEHVTGGEWRTVNTGDYRDAAIRSYHRQPERLYRLSAGGIRNPGQ